MAATKTVPRKLTNLAKEYEQQRRIKADAEKQMKQLKLDLTKGMVEAELESLCFAYEGQAYEAVITTAEVREVDVHKLFELVDLDDFVDVVKANIGDVKNAFGDVMLASVIDVSPGQETLKIRQVKE